MMTSEPHALTSRQEAIDAGFKEGSGDKTNGGKPENIVVMRELHELGHKWQRGPGAPFYKEWRSGYDAGYLGLEKPPPKR